LLDHTHEKAEHTFHGGLGFLWRFTGDRSAASSLLPMWVISLRAGLVALLHRLGMEHRKPKTVSRKLDPEKQAAFIKAYEELLNNLESDEAVLFADAVHPTHAVRPVGCWAPGVDAQAHPPQHVSCHLQAVQ
jgi:Winged helix-turn helix